MNAKNVPAYRCARCKSLYEARIPAEKCCRCKCGEPTRDLHGLSDSRCEKCAKKEWKRDAQAGLRRARAQLASAEQRLAELSK